MNKLVIIFTIFFIQTGLASTNINLNLNIKTLLGGEVFSANKISVQFINEKQIKVNYPLKKINDEVANLSIIKDYSDGDGWIVLAIIKNYGLIYLPIGGSFALTNAPFLDLESNETLDGEKPDYIELTPYISLQIKKIKLNNKFKGNQYD